jgi:hypothetical protein
LLSIIITCNPACTEFVSIQKWTGTNSALANLVEIKAREKFNRRHMEET